MPGEGMVVNLGELTKPATVLIERISDAVGGFARPWQIERVARAEAKADIIKAEAKWEITEREQRAIRRLVQEEGVKQANIEAITSEAAPLVTDQAKPEEVADDWLVHFFERSRQTSDEDMQILWAKILAGSANHPGSFSKKTVDLVAALDKSDAELFQSFAKSVISFRDYNEEDGGYTDYYPVVPEELGITGSSTWSFGQVFHLQYLGLLVLEPENSYSLADLPQEADFKYEDSEFFLNLARPTGNDVSLGRAMLTKAGQELFSILRGYHDAGYLEKVLQYWFSQGYSPASRLTAVPGAHT